MGYAGTVRICSRQYRTVERHNCKYNDQLSADRGWKGKYCKKPVNGNGLAKALKKHKGHKITIKAALKCNGITGAYSQGKKLKLK